MIRVDAGSATVDADLKLESVLASPWCCPSRTRGWGSAPVLSSPGSCDAENTRALPPILGAALALGLIAPPPTSAQTSIGEIIELRETGVLDFPVAFSLDRLGTDFVQLGVFDGSPAIAAGAPRSSGNCVNDNNVWVLFIDGDVAPLGFEGPIARTTGPGGFGEAVEAADLDGDGRNELLIGAPGCTASMEGAVWVVQLDDQARETSRVRISSGMGGFVGPTNAADRFGLSIALLGDIDGDPSTTEVAVGAPALGQVSGSTAPGSFYILGLASDGTVTWETEIDGTPVPWRAKSTTRTGSDTRSRP